MDRFGGDFRALGCLLIPEPRHLLLGVTKSFSGKHRLSFLGDNVKMRLHLAKGDPWINESAIGNE